MAEAFAEYPMLQIMPARTQTRWTSLAKQSVPSGQKFLTTTTYIVSARLVRVSPRLLPDTPRGVKGEDEARDSDTSRLLWTVSRCLLAAL